MAEKIRIECVVLWSHELKNAAAALERLFVHTEQDPEEPDEEYLLERNRLISEAFNTCYAALAGVKEETVLTVCTLPEKRGLRASKK